MPVSKYKTKRGAVKWMASFWYTDWTGARRKKKKEGFDKRSDAQAFEREFLLKNSRSCDMSFASWFSSTEPMRCTGSGSERGGLKIQLLINGCCLISASFR